ncbi:AAA family ATPase [Corallococcus exiguus]|uniref:AAA family ATPase n=1 Tax=Corallococcus exiguus TaxID=83462 RepID=UPI00155FD8C1|nr:ATP-binding protein [Corallococcus exiguus]NRD56152.1 ATP-binding protein [Corallococcus exiguus]
MPPPSEPLLPSFRIQGFRAFRDLEIPRLGRVNLIVGKNNVGKTTVLEALKVYANGAAAPWEVRRLLERRQELSRGTTQDKTPASIDIDRIYFQPPNAFPQSNFQLGPCSGGKQLSIQSGWLAMSVSAEDPGYKEDFFTFDSELLPGESQGEEVLEIRYGELPARHTYLRSLTDNSRSIPKVDMRRGARHDLQGILNCQFLPAKGLDKSDIGALWDSIVLTENEQSTLQALRIIAPDIERISLVEDPRQQGMRYALIVRKTRATPEPLHSMGDGMNRIFELALSLVSAKDGLLLIDEVENGVHYSAQEQLWRFIFEAASQLNVQVFATTHSWDCISAFQKAAAAHPEDGMLISLAQTDGDIKAAVFNEGDLEIITRESIEVR